MRRRNLFMFILFFSSVFIFSQNIYQINDFGTYIISDKGVQKIPVNYNDIELVLFCFRENFAVFTDILASKLIIYDVENNIISELLEFSSIMWPNFGIKKEGDDILVFIEPVLYVLDSKTLNIKMSQRMKDCNFADANEREEGLLQYIEIKKMIRYYYGGEYRKFQRQDALILRNFCFVLDKNQQPFVNYYKYIDIFFDNYLWEKTGKNNFSIETNINCQSELHGDRLVINVWYFNYFEK